MKLENFSMENRAFYGAKYLIIGNSVIQHL